MVVETAYPMEKNGREGHAAEPAAAAAGIQWLRKQFPESMNRATAGKECFFAHWPLVLLRTCPGAQGGSEESRAY